ncbi:hypothetical protein D9615_005993 [Tricholomella constricta]|uniref:AB hydrolase-1 domain-containing protein n=1 Tax=Tricholomella constricta TaxID=117010 RepID=A0A8H5H9D1_9AGAR|nr:hypothetical protein D9615_005993 [Tricholomella constricta]
MPMVAINPKTGPANVHYTISTPTCTSADKIDPQVPTVIFIHPVYIGQHLFQPQFSDPQLRRFNLIAVDTRLHGGTEGRVSSDWRREDAADDLAALMARMSMGACITLQTAVSYPEKVLSLFLISPLPLQEPTEVKEGRQEIYDYWVQGWQNDPHLDETALLDAVIGGLQLGFNNTNTTIGKALNALYIPRAMVNFSPERFEEFHTATVKFFTERTAHTSATLRRLQCPVKLIQCGGDIAYPLRYAQELLGRLVDAGVDAELETVEDAPHFGSVTHPNVFNPLIHDFIMSHTTAPVPPPPEIVTSPFEADLVATGWSPRDGAEDVSSEEDDIRLNFRVTPRDRKASM